MLQGITDEVKKQAAQRISSRIHDIRPWHARFNFEEKPWGADALENLKNRKKLKRAKDFLDSAHNHNCRTIVERYLNGEQYQMRMDEQGYTHTNMEYLDRAALGRKNYVATPEEKSYYKDFKTRSCNPIKEEAAAPWRTKKHPEHKQVVCGKGRIWPVILKIAMQNRDHRGRQKHGHFSFVDSTPTHTAHTAQHSLFTSAERIARAWLQSHGLQCHICAPKKSLSSGQHMSHPL